jgi:hypothetical protein
MSTHDEARLDAMIAVAERRLLAAAQQWEQTVQQSMEMASGPSALDAEGLPDARGLPGLLEAGAGGEQEEVVAMLGSGGWDAGGDGMEAEEALRRPLGLSRANGAYPNR